MTTPDYDIKRPRLDTHYENHSPSIPRLPPPTPQEPRTINRPMHDNSHSNYSLQPHHDPRQISREPHSASPYHQQRPTYGAPHSRQFSYEPANIATSASSHASPAIDSQQRPFTYYQESHPSPAEVNHHSQYHGPENRMEGVQHGMPPAMHQVRTPNGAGPPVLSQQETQYDGSSYGGGTTNDVGRRKAVRASQACESCRNKKCKCDEEKPSCGNCRSNAIKCIYRDVPPPKQERTMMEFLDHIQNIQRKQDDMLEEMKRMREDFNILQRQSQQAPAYPTSASHAPPFYKKSTFSRGQQQISNRDNAGRSHQLERQTSNPSSISAQYTPPTPQDPKLAGSLGKKPTSSTSFNEDENLDNVVIDHDVLNGDLAMPDSHTTAAHKLLTNWLPIKQFTSGITGPDYVMREEIRRGVLRLYAQGEGNDQNIKTRPSSNAPPSRILDTTTSSTSDGFWGYEDLESPDSSRRDFDDCVGGLDLEGHLRLDENHVHALIDNFLNRIHILHPLLNKNHIPKMIERFLRSISWGTKNTNTSIGKASPLRRVMQDNTEDPSRPAKRQRSEDNMRNDGEGIPKFYPAHNASSPRPNIERSINSALILFMCALGTISDFPGVIPKPANSSTPPHDPSSPQSSGSPSNTLPAGTPKGPRTPLLENTLLGHQSRRSSVGIHTPPASLNCNGRNVDKMPGLAYYAKAAAILGELHGGNELHHVHASIFASLYLSQLVRVYESWRYINSASVTLMTIFNHKDDLKHMHAERADAILLAYWTCLQLESDILAELDFPASGISKLEDQLPLPKGPTLYSTDESDTITMMYYCSQIQMRKYLNRAHTSLYTEGKVLNTGWAKLESQEIALQITEWRQTLPAQIQWNDSDPPATDINAARLRGKYYGAMYIVYRPHLHKLLDDEVEGIVNSSTSRFPPTKGANSPPTPTIAATPEGGPSLRTTSFDRNFENSLDTLTLCRRCIDAARSSTVAFDGLPGTRPIITNIFGTAHAQFGNMLVLAATRISPINSWMISAGDFDHLIKRTIKFLTTIAPMSPTHRMNVRILDRTKKIVENMGSREPQSAVSSFNSQH